MATPLHAESKTVFGIALGPLKIETLMFCPIRHFKNVKRSFFGVASQKSYNFFLANPFEVISSLLTLYFSAIFGDVNQCPV